MDNERKSKAKSVLEEIENEGHMMIVGPEKGEILTQFIREKNPKRILEVGTYVGYSAILMASESDGETVIISLEYDPENAESALTNIKKAGLENNIQVTIGDAKELIPDLPGKFDFVFIDAAKEEYFSYLKAVEEKLEMGAVVVADNVKVFEGAMSDYLDYVRGSEKYQSKTYNVGSDAIEVSIKKH